jgi:alanine racemase
VAESETLPTTYIEVDLSVIAHNVRTLKKHIGPQVILTAVVKANAYGHGAVEVARTALLHGAGRLAVARVNEGVQLREAGISAPVLVLGYTVSGDIDAAVDHDLTLAITEQSTADQLAARAAALGRTMKVHIKVDSGMGRFGLLPAEVVPFACYLRNLPALSIEGIFSHFAVADQADKTYTRQQFQTFRDVIAALHNAGIEIPIRHIANSAATLDLPDMHLDAVRTGIAMYGLRPDHATEMPLPLRPALSLKSHVGRVRTLAAGSSISYGRTFITPRAMPVALIPVGYGDGYHRLLSNRGAVLINGKRAPIVGRVCMDQFVVDISSNGPVAVNDEVVLIGSQGDDRISAEELADWAETINYEAVTSLLPRATRFYTG